MDWGGAAAGHRGPASWLWLHVFVMLGGGAIVGGLLSRDRSVHSVLWFNAATGVVAATVLGLLFTIDTWPHELSPSPTAAAAFLSFLAFNWGFPLAVLQIAGGLLGKTIARVVVRPHPALA